MSVAGLAEKIGMTRQNMSNVINNKIDASTATYGKIAEALGIPFWALFQNPQEVCGDFTAFIEYKGQMYSFHSKFDLKAWLDNSDSHDSRLE